MTDIPICVLCEDASKPANESEFLDGDVLVARVDLCEDCWELDDVLETLEERRSNWF